MINVRSGPDISRFLFFVILIVIYSQSFLRSYFNNGICQSVSNRSVAFCLDILFHLNCVLNTSFGLHVM